MGCAERLDRERLREAKGTIQSEPEAICAQGVSNWRTSSLAGIG